MSLTPGDEFDFAESICAAFSDCGLAWFMLDCPGSEFQLVAMLLLEKAGYDTRNKQQTKENADKPDQLTILFPLTSD